MTCPSQLIFQVLGEVPVKMPWQTAYLYVTVRPSQGTWCPWGGGILNPTGRVIDNILPNTSELLSVFWDIQPVSQPSESLLEIASVRTEQGGRVGETADRMALERCRFQARVGVPGQGALHFSLS